MECSFCHDPLIKELKINDLLSFKQVLFNECCSSCYAAISYQKEGSRCRYCQKVLETHGDICIDCLYWKKEIPEFCLNHHYLFDYSEIMSDYFREFKFLGDIRKRAVFSKDVSNSLMPYLKEGFIVVPIPLSKEGIKDRGFNQVEEVLAASSISYEILLTKKNTVNKQSEKGKKERLLMKQPFNVRKNKREKIQNSKILIFDDVYTTGRTLLHAYDCLLRYNPEEIRSFTLSR